MKVLLSIKPEYADKIFSGEKKYEFRRTIFRSKDVTKIIVYASSPVQKVIGEFDIEVILIEKPENLWKKTQKYAGISESYFFQYFDNKEIGYAIKVKSFIKYRKPLCLQQEFNINPPQSFAYIN